jgi:hypothetical protein
MAGCGFQFFLLALCATETILASRKGNEMTSPRAKRRILTGCLLSVVLLVGGGVWIVYQAISTSLHAECTLHAINLVTVLVDKYVDREGKWPRCWEDLRTVSPGDRYTVYSWPQDSERVQSYVTVDFDVDLASLAKQDVEGFDAIRPIGSYYPYKCDGYIAALIETIKKKTSGQHKKVR